MIEKNFDKWNNLKKDLHFNEKRKYFKEADIWFVYMGQNIGYEVFGKGERYLRPVIVFRRSGKDTFLGIPLTSKIKEDKFHTIVKFKDKINSAILNQVKTFDSKRLMYQIGKLSVDEFEKIENKFVEFYNITPSKKKGGILTKCEQRKDDKIIAQKNINIKVSIITVVWNNKETIQDAIESVLSQTYKNIEYIIIDGASTDGTVEIVKSYGDKISKFVSEPDKGLYDAMNKGVKLATGDVVGILNSDDFYVDEFVVEKVMWTFQEQEVDSVFADLIYVKPDNLAKTVRHYDSSKFHPSKFAYGWMPAHPTFFVKREVYEKYGDFKTDYKIAADYEILVRFIAKYKISYYYLKEVIIKMRIGGVSTQGIKSNYVLNKEIIRGCRENGIYANWFMVLSKYPKKLLGLIKK